jgi:hypothetical protein
MCKYVLLALLLLLVLLMAGAALVVQEYGWPGFLALLAGLVVLAFVFRLVVPWLLRSMVAWPLRRMGRPLRGARIVVHSVTPCAAPPPEEWEGAGTEDDDDGEDPNFGGRIADRLSDGDDEADADEEEDEDDEAPAGPLDWYQVELTVVPPGGGSIEGRMVTRHAWNPYLIGAVGPRPPLGSSNPFRGWPPPEQFPDSVQCHEAELWAGSEFGPLEAHVFGEQRLRLRVGVTRATQAVTITYAHFTDIGQVQLPRIDLPSDRAQ